VGTSNSQKQHVQSFTDDPCGKVIKIHQNFLAPYFLTPISTIFPEPKPFWCKNDIDVEESGSDKSDNESDDVIVRRDLFG
jgi:hypothetical protein